MQELLSFFIFQNFKIFSSNAKWFESKLKRIDWHGHQKTSRKNRMKTCGISNLNVGTYY